MVNGPQIDGGVAFLGAGRMAQALASGVVRAGLVEPGRVFAFDPDAAARERFVEAVGADAVATDSAAEAISPSGIVFLAVKPAHADAALRDAAAAWSGQRRVLVSVAAGVTLATLEAGLPAGAAVVRVMPNTPCLVGSGASCFALGAAATSDDAQAVEALLSAVGFAAQTPEKLLDAVTGLSGSGPAFVYTVIEALADGGVRAGLPRDLAAELAARTVAGAAEVVLSTGEHPAMLRDAVASPGGTTIAGLATLESRGFRSALIEAVVAATERSAELGRPTPPPSA